VLWLFCAVVFKYETANVTLVLQAGCPQNQEQYIHRLGRTARAGANGRGILLLCPFESFFLKSKTICDLPIQPYELDSSLAVSDVVLDGALAKISDEAKTQAWQGEFLGLLQTSLTLSVAWIGFYKAIVRGMKPPALVELADEFAFETCKYVGDGVKSPPVSSLLAVQ
jgi:ATP-dependent RNA helicase MSS116